MSENKLKRVLYLAPEIPALSATFVYNELLEIKALGHSVLIASVHRPHAKVDLEMQKKIGKVFFLYGSPMYKRIFSVLKSILMFNITFFAAFIMLTRDMFSVGLLDRNAAGLIFRFLSSCELAVYCHKHSIQHIHVHFAHIPTDIAMYAACMLKTPFSVTSHANDIFERGLLLRQKIERSLFFVTISSFNKIFLDKFVKKEEKIKVIHCGVDKSRFETRIKQPKNTKIIFGFLGRLVEKKGTHVLLEATALLRNKNRNFKVQIVGDGPEKARLNSIIKTHGIESRVKFLGCMSHEKVSEWLMTLDCFVLPCVKDKNGDMDGIPVSLMEAMIVGVPVISTNVSGVPELILDGQTGLIAEAGCVESLVEKMNRIININEEDIEMIVANGVEHINKHFELTNNSQVLSDLINTGYIKRD